MLGVKGQVHIRIGVQLWKHTRVLYLSHTICTARGLIRR
jgi:hypothetical protein